MALLLLLVASALADSPLTTPLLFVPEHGDPLVERARETHTLDEEMMEQLSRRWTPIHRKVAIVSALGWNPEGQTNAVTYLAWLDQNNRRVNARELATGQGLHAEEQLVLGYLMAMDDYFHPERGLPLIEQAREADPRSRTMAWVHTLVLAQQQMPDDWCTVWSLAEQTRDDPQLDDDLPDAVQSGLLAYLSLYGEYCPPGEEEVDTAPVTTDRSPSTAPPEDPTAP